MGLYSFFKRLFSGKGETNQSVSAGSFEPAVLDADDIDGVVDIDGVFDTLGDISRFGDYGSASLDGDDAAIRSKRVFIRISSPDVDSCANSAFTTWLPPEHSIADQVLMLTNTIRHFMETVNKDECQISIDYFSQKEEVLLMMAFAHIGISDDDEDIAFGMSGLGEEDVMVRWRHSGIDLCGVLIGCLFAGATMLDVPNEVADMSKFLAFEGNRGVMDCDSLLVWRPGRRKNGMRKLHRIPATRAFLALDAEGPY